MHCNIVAAMVHSVVRCNITNAYAATHTASILQHAASLQMQHAQIECN